MKRFVNRVVARLGKPILMKQTVVLADKELQTKPIFIFSTHRSGSTLLRKMLNSHNNIACPPETQYLTYFLDMLVDEKACHGLSGLVSAENVEKEMLNWSLLYHIKYARANNKSRICDKTPEYLFRWKSFHDAWGEEAQFILLIRDPLSIAASIYERKWNLLDLRGSLFENTLQYMKKADASIGELHDTISPNLFTISYRDLCFSTEGTLQSLCGYLGEDWDPAMLEPWNLSHNFGMEDPSSLGKRKIYFSEGGSVFSEEEKENILNATPNIQALLNG